ncbi:hypothetical protein MACK_004121 [Theileria orientalis]|uniref:Uncharacterized protein n=1 Tax=Theileria orientalis TaxID=68886 RepID=A0A976SJW2_THEOR|nr:hypothetical protein MACK_004121 [Theileria orientalis]
MNIFRVFSTTLYPLFVYVLLSSRRNLVESTDAGASPIPGSGTKTGVELSLKAKKATPQFNYNKAGRVVTYTAKANYGFKSVKTGNKVVWEASNSDEYATKVVLNGKGKKKKEVTIHLPNNTTKVFKRDGKGKPWSEVSQQGNQATGQPGSGTPASGSQGITGGHSMTYGSSGPMTGNGYGTPLASSGGDGTSSGNSTDQSTHGSGSTDGSGSTAQTSGKDGDKSAEEAGKAEESDGGGASPTADGGSGTDTSGGEGSGTNDDGTGKGAGEGTQKSDPDGSSATPPANPNEAKKSTNPNEADGSSATPPANPSGDGTPARTTNSLMEQFEKLVGEKLEPDKYPQDIKLFKADPNDANNPVELTKSEYKIKQLGDENLCVFYHGVNCTLLKIKDKDAWKYDSSKHNGKYPKGMNVEEKLVLVYFGEYTEICANRTGDWSPCRREEKDFSKLKVMGDPNKKGN